MPPTPPGPPGPSWRRTACVVLVWVVATAVVLLVAVDTRFGPVLMTLSDRHGVHTGDVVAFLVAYPAAAALGRRIRRAGRDQGRVTGGASERGEGPVGTSGSDR